ncbi:DUF6049 family protein [Microbacterium sp. Au-Mic1]|uniref:DUF6049 family protein n=1 Tax=Microbacterium sp. Au-Mic1 TaxID=2906457 RepID=UPI001E4FC997|nr:DUF6049 family protein [Microbacterium sp. Au-Mic1]MCE4025970.1 DUF6049 family protein [Microbacterium sp. Au-Mic1]
MTATQTESAPLRLRLRRAAGAFVVAVGLVLPLAALSPAAAAETPTPSPTQTPQHAGVQLSLQPDGNGTYASGSPLTTTLTLRNDATTGLGAGTVHLELGRTALGDRRAVGAWLDGSGDAPALSPIGDVRTTVLDAEGTSRTQIVVPAGDVGALAPGVYPLQARFEATPASADAPAPAPARSALVVAQGAPATVVTVVPITATPAGDLLSAAELAALTAPAGALTAQLNGVAGTPAVLAVDPSIPAAIRVLGAGAPATATAWLARLEALPNERFTLQFGDADATAQAAAGLSSPLTVDDFEPFLNPAGKTPTTPSPTPTSTSTASPSQDPAAPDAIAGARTDILWPRGQVTAGQVATMSHYGPAGAGTVPILPSTSFTAGAQDAPVSSRGVVGGTSVLVSDEAVSEALSAAAGQSDAAARGDALTEANAMLWFDAPGSTVLAGLSRTGARSQEALSSAITAFSGGQDGRLDRVLSSPPADLAMATESAEDRAAAVTVLNEDAGRLAQFATILVRPADLTVRERISMLRLLGVGVHTTADDFAAALGTHRTATQKTLNAVGIQPSNPILISPKVDVPVWVRNDLPYPVRVRLNVSSSDSRIDVPATTDVEAQPSSTTRVRLPLESHVANTELTLTMTLTSPTGVAIGPAQTARLTIRAEWETIGLIVFGSLGVLLIGAGIFRTVRRRRAAAEKHAADGMEASDGGVDGHQPETPTDEDSLTEGKSGSPSVDKETNE